MSHAAAALDISALEDQWHFRDDIDKRGGLKISSSWPIHIIYEIAAAAAAALLWPSGTNTRKYQNRDSLVTTTSRIVHNITMRW